MSFDIDVVIDFEAPDVEISSDELESLVATTLKLRDISAASVSVIITDHSVVRHLNVTYLDHDYNTDVLSFKLSTDDDPKLDGEVYVDVETAIERCHEFNASALIELYRYAIHGVLHLTGMDDATDELRLEMRAVEDQILDTLLSK